ncbi:acetyl-CoA synthetase-like protein [Epithele typhae]|uniref:acetyl-CoA synthetase-like protein n=1 Tax=Epithele typhae TaxID=378194 RepID=UPI00200864AC|nr:acetyl-CoA synthetase-like protein [Epithele typhae]KAH9941837.1 acetyl-CoA synthetase-like protein [Epithele typhae]
MPAQLKTHLHALAEAVSSHSDLPIYKLPAYDSEDVLRAWTPISFAQFQADVNHFAAHLARKLSADGVPSRSVVGLWSNGMSYVDILYIYSLARAGFVPQLFSLRLPNPDVIYELLAKAGGKAMVYEPELEPMLATCPVPSYRADDLRDAPVDLASLPPLYEPASADEIAMIFHTSGSTSGRPKLLPCDYKWLDAMVHKSAWVSPPLRAPQDVTVAMGSMCHIGQTFMFLATFQHGGCTLQPRAVTFSSAELAHMIAVGGLSRLNQFPAFFAVHVRAARGDDAKLLALLQTLDEILYSGQPMPLEDEGWAYAQDLPLRNLFGSTECGAMLLSVRGGGRPTPVLRPVEGTHYAFLPIPDAPELEEEADSSESGYANANAQLLELVVLASSPDCPHASMRAADGHFHTGDLFLEAAPGAYVSRGRNDDWIKTQNALRCDTRAVEDNARAQCADLIATCVAVGNGRPSPALFVEAAAGALARCRGDEARLRREVVRRTRAFHQTRYLHERIADARFVVVVPEGTLPRTATKGNVRRRAVEEMFKAELDAMFA